VALLGAAYRGNSEDTRNSPTLFLARGLQSHGVSVRIHDPYVHATDANLKHFGVTEVFTRELPDAVGDAEVLFICCPHRVYADGWEAICAAAPGAKHLVDACHLMCASDVEESGMTYTGIGRGQKAPPAALVAAVYAGFRAVEAGTANEVEELVRFLNARYAHTAFNRVTFSEVQRIAATCPTGCAIRNPGPVLAPDRRGPPSRLVAAAAGQALSSVEVASQG
jgi:hypothetical protein